MEIKLNLSSSEQKELVSYCNLNDLLISEVVKKSFTTGFNIERYGLLSEGTKVIEKEVEKIVEKRVEIPVEIEKEVVKIEYVEIPVEVIKEVEKIVEVEKIFQDDSKIEQLTQEFSTKIQEMENIFQKEKEQLINKINELGEGKVIETVREVPIEVIKEVIVEKEIGTDLKPKLDALQVTVQKLRQETIEKDKKIKELESTILEIQKLQEEKKTVYLSGSNLDKTLKK